MDAGHFDVLHHATNVDIGSIAERIEVDLDRAFQEFVEVDRVIGGDLRGLGHVGLKLIRIVDDRHAASAQHVAGTHEQREADVLCHAARLFVG